MISLLSVSVGVEAQSDAGSDAEARLHFEEGRAAYEAGEFEAAVGAFRQAYVLSPRYALLYNIGQSELRVGHNAEALEAFEGFLRQAPEDDVRRSEVEERVRQLRAMSVTPTQVTLPAEGAAAEASEPAPAPRSAEPSGDADVVPWIVTGIGGALLLTGAALMGVGASEASRLTSAPVGSRWSEFERVGGDAETLWAAGIALASVGLAAVGAGLVWALLPNDSTESAHAELRVGVGSISLEGAF